MCFPWFEDVLVVWIESCGNFVSFFHFVIFRRCDIDFDEVRSILYFQKEKKEQKKTNAAENRTHDLMVCSHVGF